MMNISIENLSLTEDMVSEVIILRIFFYFPWQSKIADKRLLKEHYNILFVKVSATAWQ